MTGQDHNPFDVGDESSAALDELRHETSAAEEPPTKAEADPTPTKRRGRPPKKPKPAEMRAVTETPGPDIVENFLDEKPAESEVERLAREQREDDEDEREQGPPKASKPKPNDGAEREPDPLDGFSPLADVHVRGLRPENRAILVRGIVSKAKSVLDGVASDIKSRGFPFEEDLELVAVLCRAAAELCAKTGLDFRGEREASG